MPVQINILQGGIGIEFISSGVVTGKEIIEANKKIYNRENLLRLKYKIIDRSTCTDYRVTSEEIRSIAAQDIEASKINKNIVILLVSPTTLQYGMTRMWQAHIEGTGFQSEIFKDRESANEYINKIFNKSKMKIEIDDKIQSSTKGCQKDFSCLTTNIESLCKVSECINGIVRFVKCEEINYCNYKTPFGQNFSCACPIRKEIYNKYKV